MGGGVPDDIVVFIGGASTVVGTTSTVCEARNSDCPSSLVRSVVDTDEAPVKDTAGDVFPGKAVLIPLSNDVGWGKGGEWCFRENIGVVVVVVRPSFDGKGSHTRIMIISPTSMRLEGAVLPANEVDPWNRLSSELEGTINRPSDGKFGVVAVTEELEAGADGAVRIKTDGRVDPVIVDPAPGFGDGSKSSGCRHISVPSNVRAS
jgi:hypothetical protein